MPSAPTPISENAAQAELPTAHGVPSRVVLEVNLETMRENYAHICQAVQPARVIAVLKADAYGLGMAPIAKALAQAGVAAIAVAELREALVAAQAGVPVLLLGYALPFELEPAIRAGVRIAISDFEGAQSASRAASRLGLTAIVHFAVDTGMGRLGFHVDQAVHAIIQAVRLPNIRAEGIYSHFPMAYRPADGLTLAQIQRFKQCIADCESAGVTFDWRHIANSDAINNFAISTQPPFTHVRTGINLHGSFDTEGKRVLKLEPVLTLRAKLAQKRLMPAGSTIGYGASYTCAREQLVGTVAAGYADGVPLALSNRGYFLIRGRPCPVLGRVSMDYTTVSLEQVPDASPGDDVICLGTDGTHSISVEEWAALKGTHPYEVICSIGSRVQRLHITSTS